MLIAVLSDQKFLKAFYLLIYSCVVISTYKVKENTIFCLKRFKTMTMILEESSGLAGPHVGFFNIEE